MNLVLAHVRSHANAADTFDGIARWWLGADWEAISPDALRIALERLVEAGTLSTRPLPAGETLWCASCDPGPFPDSGALGEGGAST